MSGFVDFVIADRRESKKLLKHATPTKQWPGFEWKWVDEFQLAYLYGVLRDAKDRYALADELKIDRLRTGESVTELPARMTELLAGLNKKARASVAKEWRKCEEFFDSGDQKGTRYAIWLSGQRPQANPSSYAKAVRHRTAAAARRCCITRQCSVHSAALLEAVAVPARSPWRPDRPHVIR